MGNPKRRPLEGHARIPVRTSFGFRVSVFGFHLTSQISSAGLSAMNSRNLRPVVSCAFLICFVWSARADVRLPAIISDNMVLQQKMAAPIWGWAEEGEEVKVTFRGKTVKTKVKNGKWLVKLSRLREGGPDIMVIEGKNRIEIKNVLVGEVWVASGQSNME